MGKMVTVAPLKNPYRFRDDETKKVLDFGVGETRIPEQMAINLHAQGLIPDFRGAQATEATDSDLPDDLPGRKALIAAGHTTLAKVQALETFEGIEGVGAATIAKLGDYFSDSK